MASPLVVSGRAEAATRFVVELEPVDERVEGEVEVETGLFPVGDHVEPGPELVADRGPDRVARCLLTVVGAELVQMRSGELEPAGERIAPDDGRANGAVRHGQSLLLGRLDSYTVTPCLPLST